MYPNLRQGLRRRSGSSSARAERRDEGTRDHCSGRLYQREDDRSDSIVVRLEACERSSAPLIQFYRYFGLLTLVVAMGSPRKLFYVQ